MATSASTPRILSKSGRLKDANLRVSVMVCLPGRMVLEIGCEPLQEARHAKQRHRARHDEEAALEVLAEQAAAQAVGFEVAVRQVGELGEEAAKVPARNEQEQRERQSQHDQQRSRGKARGLDEDEAARLQEWQQAAEVGRRSEEHTSELQSLMRTSYAVFCLKKKKIH